MYLASAQLSILGRGFLVISCPFLSVARPAVNPIRRVEERDSGIHHHDFFMCSGRLVGTLFKLPMNDINALALGFVRPRLGKSSQNLVGGHASLLFKSLNFTLADTPYYIFYHVPSVAVTAILSVLISRLLDPPFAH